MNDSIYKNAVELEWFIIINKRDEFLGSSRERETFGIIKILFESLFGG